MSTAVVAGFMLGHALILGRFLEWMLANDPGQLAATYPVFARSAGSGGLTAFYAICWLQGISALAFLAVALGVRRHRLGAGVAAFAAVLWPAVHYGSGFAALEAVVLRGVTPAPADVVARFLAWSPPVHMAHVATLLVGLVALLTIPLAARAP